MENKKEKTIESLQEFIGWVSSFREKNPHKEYFFRGHSNLKYELVPAVYRINRDGGSYRGIERSMYFEMLNQAPSSFRDDDVFGNLVKMQHLGLPTRLLDVTRNSLVALYFCCKTDAMRQDGPEGCVFADAVHSSLVYYPIDLTENELYFPNYEKVKSGTSDEFWAGFISDLTRRMHLEFVDWQNDSGRTSETIDEIMASLGDCFRFYSSASVSDPDCRGFLKLKASLERQKILLHESGDYEAESVLNFFGAVRDTRKRWGFGCANFSLCQFWDEITVPQWVSPPINNPRIAAQQGAFILFPPHPLSTRAFSSPENHISGVDGESVVVPNQAKASILSELKFFGVSEHTLFPEIDRIANFVREKYAIKF